MPEIDFDPYDPTTILDAVRTAEDDNRFIQTNLDTYRSHDRYGVWGGWGFNSRGSQRRGLLSGSLTPELIEIGRQLVEEWGQLERESEEKVAQRHGISLEGTNLTDALEGMSHGVQDTVCNDSRLVLLEDPRAVAYFEKHLAYGESVVARLKSLV